jgi:hypothetical protein
VLPVLTDSPATLGALAAVKVNSSAEPLAELPVGPTTTTSTTPADPAGAVAEIDVSEMTVKSASTPPKRTSPAPRKPVPLMLTTVPPAVLPEEVPRPVTPGGLAAVTE